MESANVIVRILATSQVVLFLFLLIRSSNPIRVRLIGSGLVIGVLCYLIAPIVNLEIGAEVAFVLWFFAGVIPSFILLFVWAVFEEEPRMAPHLIALVVLQIGASIWVLLVFAGVISGDFSHTFVQLTKLVVLLAAILLIWRGAEDDLVEQRWKLRRLLVYGVSVIALVVVVVELITNFAVPLDLEVMGMTLIFIVSIATNLLFVAYNPSIKLVVDGPIAAQTTDDPVLIDLLMQMTRDRLYANYDLRIKDLAELVRIPEYQLRKKINTGLGFRNFNRFINHHRIEEASQRLLSEPRMPILSIALDVGFRSISSFNTAFHQQFSMTPTKYRKGGLSES